MKSMRILQIALLLLLAKSVSANGPGGMIVGWGYEPPLGSARLVTYSYSTGIVMVAGHIVNDCISISAGQFHGLSVCGNGTVMGWGFNRSGQATGSTEAGAETSAGLVRINQQILSNVVAVSAGWTFSLGLKKDGSIAEWGAEKQMMPENIDGLVAIASGPQYCLALKRDGTVIGWGETKTPSGLSNVIAIAVPRERVGNNLALRSDGTVLEWSNGGGDAHIHGGLSNVVAIAAGAVHYLALKKDGTVSGWGSNQNGEINVPEGLTNVIAIAASGTTILPSGYSLALKSDGTVVAWGKMGLQKGSKAIAANVPDGLTNVVSIAAGPSYCLAITTDPAASKKFGH